MSARELLAAATPRPWSWRDAGETTRWATEDELIRYRLLQGGNRFVLEHAQTWQIRDAEADLIVAAVNEYEALLDIAEAARDYLALSTYDQDPRTWNASNFAAANGLGESLARLDATRSTP